MGILILPEKGSRTELINRAELFASERAGTTDPFARSVAPDDPRLSMSGQKQDQERVAAQGSFSDCNDVAASVELSRHHAPQV
jgi:hypothetical protein